MRSDLIHIAMAQGNNRFEICRKVGRGVRLTHLSGTRMQESITYILGRLGAEPAVPLLPPTLVTEAPAA